MGQYSVPIPKASVKHRLLNSSIQSIFRPAHYSNVIGFQYGAELSELQKDDGSIVQVDTER